MSQESLEELLRDTQQCGVYQAPHSGRLTLERAAEAVGIGFAECDFEDCEDKDEALGALAEALDFPEWFGGTFDALHDCLTDLSWRESPATVLFLTGCDQFQYNDSESFATLLEVLIAATEFWRDEEVPFWVFVDLTGEEAAALPTID